MARIKQKVQSFIARFSHELLLAIGLFVKKLKFLKDSYFLGIWKYCHDGVSAIKGD